MSHAHITFNVFFNSILVLSLNIQTHLYFYTFNFFITTSGMLSFFLSTIHTFMSYADFMYSSTLLSFSNRKNIYIKGNPRKCRYHYLFNLSYLIQLFPCSRTRMEDIKGSSLYFNFSQYSHLNKHKRILIVFVFTSHGAN